MSKLFTKYGVEIKTDSNGNPLPDNAASYIRYASGGHAVEFDRKMPEEMPDWWQAPFFVSEVNLNCWRIVTSTNLIIAESKYEDDAITICNALNKVYKS